MKKNIYKSVIATFTLSLLLSTPAFGMKKLLSKLCCCFTTDIEETHVQGIVLNEEELEEPEPLPEPEPEPEPEELPTERLKRKKTKPKQVIFIVSNNK